MASDEEIRGLVPRPGAPAAVAGIRGSGSDGHRGSGRSGDCSGLESGAKLKRGAGSAFGCGVSPHEQDSPSVQT